MVIIPYNSYLNLYAKKLEYYVFSLSRKSNLHILCPVVLTNVRTTVCSHAGALTAWRSSLHLIYRHRKIKRGLFSSCKCLMTAPGWQLSISGLLLGPRPVAGEGAVNFNIFWLSRRWVSTFMHTSVLPASTLKSGKFCSCHQICTTPASSHLLAESMCNMAPGGATGCRVNPSCLSLSTPATPHFTLFLSLWPPPPPSTAQKLGTTL